MIGKSNIFTLFSALLFVFFIHGTGISQAVIAPSEIKEALTRISSDAKDSLKLYQGELNPEWAKRAKAIRQLDSLALANQEATLLTALFRNSNSPFDKIPYQYRAKFQGEFRKKWVLHQVSNSISGGKWNASALFDGIKKPEILPGKKDYSSPRISLKPEVEKTIGTEKRKLADKPLTLLLSYPSDGAFNVYRKELNGPVWGYAIFNKPIIDDKPGGDRTLLARWTSQTGAVRYSYTEAGYSGDLHFTIPENFLEARKIYQLELVWVENTEALRPFWNASCFGGFQFYNIDPSSVIADWVGTSAPVSQIYFRVSEAENSLIKLYKKPGTYNAAQQSYTIALEEPLDSFEVFGNAIMPPRISLFDMQGSGDQDNIFKPIVANYLLTPRTGAVDTVNVTVLHPFEQARLVNQDFIYKMDESKNIQLAKISPEENTTLRNGYTIHGIGKPVPQISVAGKMPPKITRQHFTGKATIQKTPFQLVITSTRAALREKQQQEVQQLLQRRVKERALFFYGMEVRACKREGKRCPKKLSDFEKMEMDNLPPTIKSILNGPAPAATTAQKSTSYSVSVQLPGSTQQTTSFTIDF